MNDTQWMIVLHVTIFILQAILGIVQYLIQQGQNTLLDEVRQLRQNTLKTGDSDTEKKGGV